MQPFEEFRRWLSRASTSEKTTTGLAVALVLAILVWVLVPTSTQNGQAAFGLPSALPTGGSASANGSAPATVPGVLAPRSGQPVGPGGTTIGGAASGAAGAGAAGISASAPTSAASPAPGQTAVPGTPACAGSSAPGVTSKTIKIAVTVAQIFGPAGNKTFGLPTPDEQKQKYNAVIAAVNAHGGIACRQVVPQYYTVNPADNNDMHAKCLDIASAGVFAVIDDGGEYASADCFGQRHIAFLAENLLFAQTASRYYPYLMSAYNFYDAAYRTAIFGLKQRGFFDPARGFKKLGFMYFSCHPELISEMTNWFHQVGLSDSDIVTYDASCPSPPLASPSDLQQAILRFKASGVSNVVFAYFMGSIGNFTTIAQQQGFHPTYGLADDGYIGVSYGASRPNPSNFNGAVTITTSRYGEENTPGYKPTAGTETCNRIFVKAHLTPLYQQPAPSNGGMVCNLLGMLRTAVDHAAALAPDQLAQGLQAAQSIDFAYPGGPNNFAATHGVAGGAAWRAARYVGGCRCWKLADPTFHPL